MLEVVIEPVAELEGEEADDSDDRAHNPVRRASSHSRAEALAESALHGVGDVSRRQAGPADQ